MITMTRTSESTAPTGGLLLAFELGQRSWKLGFTVGMGQRPRIRQMPAGAVSALVTEIERAKKRFGLSSDTPVTSCYEAGRDGFWLHRYLVAYGITNYVVDSSSIEVNRRARRAKTDRLDLAGLLSLLARYVLGDRRAWRVVRVPTVAEEDARHLPRTLEALTQDRSRLMSRLKSLLTTQGVSLPIDGQFLKQLKAAHLWDGTPLPPGLHERLTRTWTQLRDVNGQIRDLKALRLTRPENLTPATSRVLAQLLTMRAIGPIGASVLATEIFGWRRIRNRRELGALVGLVPAPYQSGETDYDQGITRAGNAHVRRVIVQLAWGWIRHQPDSALTHWYQQRFGAGGKRLRKIGIVALARKLLIALWRYLETGVVPDGAQLKPMEV
ncbi:MAG: IS110 family transposase [Acidobacteria bacterium]|nr:MAG: IS110 family transposase [Acidobacteriota bacterium]PYR04381.1 MAG: IS110 family transposase [Acidobacteriota bacterium]